MAELMLVNPRRRRKAKAKARKNPIKKRAVARAPRRAANPRKRRRNPVAMYTPKANPRRRRALRRRNPIAAGGMVNQMFMPALTAAGGALALDMAWGFLPIPDNIQTGPLRHIAKGAGALALGYVAGMVVNKTTARQMATGALTVVMHGALKEMAAMMLPNVNLGYYSAGMPMGVGEYVPGGLGELSAYTGGAPVDSYLARSLSEPFAGPSAAQQAVTACLETEKAAVGYYHGYTNDAENNYY